MSRLEQRLSWARDQVGVPPEAPLPEVRTRFLAAVERENFVPDESLDRAFRTLRWEAEGVIDAEDPPEFLQAEESELHDDVEAFAAKMFSWPMAERRQRWADLYRRCEYSPRLRARLERLAPGLDVELNAADESGRQMHVETLTRYAAELFPLRPAARAARRHAILGALHKDEIKPWRKAAQSLKNRNPTLAALAPDLIDQVATAGTAAKKPAAVTVRRETSPHRGTGWGLGVAACILISFIVRAAMMSSSSPSTPVNQKQNADLQRIMEQLRQNQQQAPPPNSQFSPAAAPEGFAPQSIPNWTPERWGERINVQEEMESIAPPTRRPGEPWPSAPTPGERFNPAPQYRPPGAGPGSPSPIPSSTPSYPSGF
jgi:hypothetical protein